MLAERRGSEVTRLFYYYGIRCKFWNDNLLLSCRALRIAIHLDSPRHYRQHTGFFCFWNRYIERAGFRLFLYYICIWVASRGKYRTVGRQGSKNGRYLINYPTVIECQVPQEQRVCIKSTYTTRNATTV